MMDMAEAARQWKLREAQGLIRQIEALLHGKAPELQSVVLADLAADWAASIRPGMRADLLAKHIQLIHTLVEPHVQKRFGWHA